MFKLKHKKDLLLLTSVELLDLYEEFVKRGHYDPTDTFDYMKEYDFSKYDVREEIESRLSYSI